MTAPSAGCCSTTADAAVRAHLEGEERISFDLPIELEEQPNVAVSLRGEYVEDIVRKAVITELARRG